MSARIWCTRSANFQQPDPLWAMLICSYSSRYFDTSTNVSQCLSTYWNGQGLQGEPRPDLCSGRLQLCLCRTTDYEPRLLLLCQDTRHSRRPASDPTTYTTDYEPELLPLRRGWRS